jgi:RNA polymerase sigma-70 factor (ECF subfamily)
MQGHRCLAKAGASVQSAGLSVVPSGRAARSGRRGRRTGSFQGGIRHDRDGDTLGGWLRTITANKVRDFQRKLAKRDRGVGGSDAQRQLREITEDKLPGSDEDSLREDNLLLYRRAVEMILAGCEEQTRQVFLRVVIERQAAAAVAREMGITVNAVYLAKSRVLRRIRQEFAGVVKV